MARVYSRIPGPLYTRKRPQRGSRNVAVVPNAEVVALDIIGSKDQFFHRRARSQSPGFSKAFRPRTALCPLVG